MWPDAVSVGVYDVTPLKLVGMSVSLSKLHPFLAGNALTDLIFKRDTCCSAPLLRIFRR